MSDTLSKQLQFMIVPSLFCPASCGYCFGPNEGPKMSTEMMGKTLGFIERISNETNLDKLRITFHGGEPLAAGYPFFERFLNDTEVLFPDKKKELNIQSNLWLLDERYCTLFRQHHVSIGTSLDGPEHITDRQRGKGYFRRTIKGIALAQQWGLDVGCIATFTKYSLPYWREIADFFISEQIHFSVHSAVPPLEQNDSEYVLSPDQKADLLLSLLDYYIRKRKEITISTFDQMCKSIPSNEGKICTFRDCLGMFLAIDPQGYIYPCQRFSGKAAYRMGNVADQPSWGELFKSPIAERMRKREQQAQDECHDCSHYSYCKGGCCYNAWASGTTHQTKDPYCQAYAATFDYIREQLNEEMASKENIDAIAQNPFSSNGNLLLRKGSLIELTCSGPHPSQIARNAKRIIAAVELAKGPNINAVAERLVQMDICRNENTALASLDYLQRSLKPTEARLNNLYLHITFACQLYCTHCYAEAGMHHKEEMPVTDLEKLVIDAKAIGFRQVIITGGEPLLHSQRSNLLLMLIELKNRIAPMNLVLRTNFALPFREEEIKQIALAFHQVVVSIDGDQQTHDDRRGRGSYRASEKNMQLFQNIAKSLCDAVELSIATVMRSQEIQGEAGFAVKDLAHRLAVKRTRFRPLLPLGRANDWDEPPQSEALGSYLDPLELIENGFTPVSSCGIGQNLYVEPSGESFPCYAYHLPHSYLGNVIKKGLGAVLESASFKDLSRHDVDTNGKCQNCEVRYLCGGACRAWGGEAAQYDLDAPPPECNGLKQSALGLLNTSRAYLGML